MSILFRYFFAGRSKLRFLADLAQGHGRQREAAPQERIRQTDLPHHIHRHIGIVPYIAAHQIIENEACSHLHACNDSGTSHTAKGKPSSSHFFTAYLIDQI